jgi:5'-deoxynucleotidase YfbR-like HD superfamily hydrolase
MLIEAELDAEEYDEYQYINEDTGDVIKDSDIIDVYVEKHEKYYFAYNSKNHSFMAQGFDKESLETALLNRYPNKLFNVDEEMLEKLGLV